MQQFPCHISSCSKYVNTSSDLPHVQDHLHINRLASSVSIILDFLIVLYFEDQYNVNNTMKILQTLALYLFHELPLHHFGCIVSILSHFQVALFHCVLYNLQVLEESKAIHHLEEHSLYHLLNEQLEQVLPNNADVQRSIHGNDNSRFLWQYPYPPIF